MLDTNRDFVRGNLIGKRPMLHRVTAHERNGSTATSVQESPMIEVSESDGIYKVCADFRMIPDAKHVTVEFARQGIVITGGTIERYVPIPTDGDIELSQVEVGDGVARIAVPTAGLGQRWRAIVMW